MTAMTKRKAPPLAEPDPHDPFKMRTLEQILTLFDGGEFLAETMEKHRQLMVDLIEHNAEFGPKGCDGSVTIKIKYAVGNAGDVGMSARATFESPKRPPSSAAAFINDAGELTLYSPMMRRMQTPIRDVTEPDHDFETGEIRDAD